MEEITSLIITRKAPAYWVYQVNDEDFTRDANAYTATREGDLFTIKTRTGAPQILVNYAVVQYIDEATPANNLTDPSSPEVLQGHLIAQGFYEGSTGGGTGGVTTFKALLDTFASFAGREGQNVIVGLDGENLDTAPNTIPKIQNLINYLGGDYLPPNVLFITSSIIGEDGSSIGFRTMSPYNLINRPMQYNEEGVIIKGYNGFDEAGSPIWNTEDYAKEIGDICWVWRLPAEPDDEGRFVPKLSKAQWLGGTDYDFSISQEFNNFT